MKSFKKDIIKSFKRIIEIDSRFRISINKSICFFKEELNRNVIFFFQFNFIIISKFKKIMIKNIIITNNLKCFNIQNEIIAKLIIDLN